MRQMITNYGMNAQAEALQAGETSYQIAPHDIDFLLDTLLATMPANGFWEDDLTITFKDQPLKISDALKMIQPHLQRIRLQSIGNFETYFKADQTTDRLVQDFHSGDAKAKRVMRHIGIFPIEAMNVRTELAHPELLRINVASSEDNSLLLLRQVFGPMALVHIRGPHLPPMTTEQVVDHFQGSIPEVDKLARDVISGAKKMPTPSAMN